MLKAIGTIALQYRIGIMVRFFLCCVLPFLILSSGPGRAFAQEIDRNSVVYIKCALDGKNAAGSGVIIDAEGRLLTARHVALGRGAECRGVRGTSATEPSRSLTVTHVSNVYDMAVLAFVPDTDEVFAPVPYTRLVVGMPRDGLVAQGFPEGHRGEPVRRAGSLGNLSPDGRGMIRSDALTSEGMSGGPVVLNGKLVGIVAGAEFSERTSAVVDYAVLAVEAFENEIRSFLTVSDLQPQQSMNDLLRQELAGDDPCTQLFRQRVRQRYPNWLAADEDTPSRGSELSDRSEFWVTITTGPARWLNCRGGTTAKMIYFPMGLILRPVSDVTIEGEVQTIFQTEYGLRVIIDRRALSPVDAGFVFARGNGVFKLCTQTGDSCDPGEELRIRSVTREHWPYLAGYLSYLRTDDIAGLEEANNELHDFSVYQDALLEGGLPDPLAPQREPATLDDDPACLIREAHLFAYSTRFEPEAELQGSQYLVPLKYSLCTHAPDGKIVSRATRIKVVTPDIAREKFRKLFSVSTVRNPTENMIAVTKALADSQRPIATTLGCGSPGEGWGSLGSPKSIEAYFPRTATISLNEAIRAERANFAASQMQIFFRQFQTYAGLSDSPVLRDTPLFNDIVLRVTCNAETGVDRVDTVSIDFSPVFHSDPIVISMHDLDQIYVNRFQSYGYRSSQERKQALADGVVDRICDYVEYVNWHQILFDALKRQPKVGEAADTLGIETRTMADHIAHLLLATIFTTDVYLRKPGQPERCLS